MVPYLKERFSVYLKREVLNLISLTADFPFTYLDPSLQQPPMKIVGAPERMLDRLMPPLKYLKKMHFPLKSRELLPNTNESQNFHVIMDSFLNMAVITKNLEILRHLYCIIREHKTTFERSLKSSLNIIVTQ